MEIFQPIKPITRGDKNIAPWLLRCMIDELTQASRLVERGMREQANKEKLLNYLHSEINELKELRNKR